VHAPTGENRARIGGRALLTAPAQVDAAAMEREVGMMRRRIQILVGLLAVLLITSVPAQAVTYGTPDYDHTFVGGLVTLYQGQYILICSGTMISATTYVTAGHCTSLLQSLGLPAFVTFDQAFDATDQASIDRLVPGTMVTHPGYVDADWPYTPDIAVVLLDWDPGVGYASLPDIGLLDSLTSQKGFRKIDLTAVGYGASGYTRGGGPPQQIYLDQRLMASTAIRLGPKPILLNGTNVFHSADPGHGGGTCNGDSGGPIFYGFSVLLGVTSGGQNVGFDNMLCTNPHQFAFRLDTQEAQDFLLQYM
jgi:trypsin